MFRDVFVNVGLEFSRVWYMVQTVILSVGDVSVIIKSGKSKIAAVMYKALILREHTFIIVESREK